MNYIIKYKKWWHRFIPKYHRCIRYLRAYHVKNEAIITKMTSKHFMDVVLYGKKDLCSTNTESK